MASAFAHAAAALAIGSAFRPRRPPRRFWLLAIACSMAPDVDVTAFAYGIPYEHWLGHRGFLHSLVAAAGFGALALLLLPRRLWPERRWVAWLAFTACAASHGVLDAMTTGGLGVGFFSPFENSRWFLPWRPILVSPVDPEAFFSARGLAILKSEALWVGLPSAIVLAVSETLRFSASRRSPTPRGTSA
jgi:inner membrane protein